MLAAIPATHREWLPREILAGLFPIGEPNAERHHVDDDSELLLVDPRLIMLFETMSMALMSQTIVGAGVPQDSDTAARFVHDMFLLWTSGRPPATAIGRLDDEQTYFGSLMTRRAIDFVVAHELGHIIANQWPHRGPMPVPASERGGVWQFEMRQFSLEWDRELRADSVACWILSHSVLEGTLSGQDRRDFLMAVFAGAAMVLAIATIHEEVSQSQPVIESRERTSRRLHWDESRTHPAAFLRAREILKFLTAWMGPHDEAENYAKFVLERLPMMWREGNARPRTSRT